MLDRQDADGRCLRGAIQNLAGGRQRGHRETVQDFVERRVLGAIVLLRENCPITGLDGFGVLLACAHIVVFIEIDGQRFDGVQAKTPRDGDHGENGGGVDHVASHRMDRGVGMLVMMGSAS